MSKKLQDLIQFLQANNFKAEYPNCTGTIKLFNLQTKVLKELRQEARMMFRKTANYVDKLYNRQKMNPDYAKLIFLQLDYVVFIGLKVNETKCLKKS
jgi:hypothetical protein